MQFRVYLILLKWALALAVPVVFAACVSSPSLDLPTANVSVLDLKLNPVWTAGRKFDFVAEIDDDVVQADAASVPSGTLPKIVYQLHQMPMHLEAEGEVEQVGSNGSIRNLILTVKSYRQITQSNSLGALDQIFAPGTRIGFVWDGNGEMQYSVNGQPSTWGEYLFLGFLPLFFAPQNDLQLYGPKGRVTVGDTWLPSRDCFERILLALENQGFMQIEGLKGSMKLESIKDAEDRPTEAVTGDFTFDHAISPGFDPFFWGIKPTFHFTLSNSCLDAPASAWKRGTNLTARAQGVPVTNGASSPILSEIGQEGMLTVVDIKTLVEITLK